ncbi:hypothetical protein ACFE04_004144 [Oxalis oulophora]
MAPVSYLPDDILWQVFVKLSYKQSRRCSLPCTISRFTRSRTRLVPIGHHLYTTLRKTTPFFSLDFLPTTSNNVHILRYSHDLFLCTGDLDKHDVYYICNPMSKEWISLPPTPSPHREASVGFYCDISYDKYENGNSTIWIVKNLQKYIVVRHLEVFSSMELAVFYSETNTWRNYVESVPQENFAQSSWILMAIMYNGRLWYMPLYRCIYVYNPDHLEDSNEQRWDIIDVPSRIHDYCNPYMGVTNGRMRISQIFTHDDKIISRDMHYEALRDMEPCLRIWEFDDDVREWSLVHNVYLKDLDEKFNQSLRSIVGSRLNMEGIHFHPVDEDMIYIVFDIGYFEYNVRLKVMEFHPIEIRTKKQGLFMGRRDPFMQPWRPTPI